MLVSCMTASILTACGSTGDNASQSTVKTSQSAASTNTASAGASSEAVSEDTDDLSEKVTFEVLVEYRNGEKDWNEYYFVKKIEELYNVDLQIEMIDSEVWGEKLALRFASKDLPDFIINNLGNAVDTALYGEQGFLADLTDYITEETAPNITKMWEDVPASKASVTSSDGCIYSISGVDNENMERDRCRFYINEDWAIQILGKLPENTDEFYQFLKGVKEQDMDGDGDPNNEIPLGGYYNQNSSINAMTMLRSAFGLLDKYWQVMDNGEVIYTRSSDNYKEMLKYMKMLYEEELLDPEFFTQTSDQFAAKDSQYLYGAYGSWGPANNKSAEDAASGKYKVYVGMPAITSSVNDTPMWPAGDMTPTGQFTVMADCEHIERAVAIVDWLLSEEGFLATMAGPQFGEDEKYPQWGYSGGAQDFFTINEAGEVGKFPEEYTDVNSFIYAERRPNTGSVPFYRCWTQAYVPNGQGEWLSKCTAGTHLDYYKTSYPSATTMTTEENDELSLLLVDIDSYTDEMESKMIMGELDIDETWDTYLEGLRQRGIDDAIQIKQTVYDRYIAN